MSSVLMSSLSWVAYQERLRDDNLVVFIPCGALEQHGPHLPLGTDAMLSTAIAQDNMRINALCPGPVETPMLQMEFDLTANPANAKAEGIATMPIGRLGQPKEIAQVALFLASEAPALMHGASVVVDGGKTIF